MNQPTDYEFADQPDDAEIVRRFLAIETMGTGQATRPLPRKSIAAQSALDAYANDKLEQAAQIVWDVSENDVAVHAVRSIKKGEP